MMIDSTQGTAVKQPKKTFLFQQKYWRLMHRYIGLISCLAVLMWGISGVLHPIMSRLQPRPAKMQPPTNIPESDNLKNILSPDALLKLTQISTFTSLNTITWQGRLYYRIVESPQKPARIIQAFNGFGLPEGDKDYAIDLARYYLNAQALNLELASTRFVTQFEEKFQPLQRYLPVWEICFKQNELCAYIDTHEAKLVSLNNSQRQILISIFSALHRFSFLDAYPKTKITIMTIMLICISWSVISGIYIFLVSRKNSKLRLKKQAIQRWHRYLSLLFISTVAFIMSGAFHLWHGYLYEDKLLSVGVGQSKSKQWQFKSSEISIEAWQKIIDKIPNAHIHLARLNDKPVWLMRSFSAPTQTNPVAKLANEEHQHHHKNNSMGSATKKKCSLHNI